MGGLRKDFIERLIEQLAQAVARLLRIQVEQGPEEARRALGEACDELLGMDYRVLSAVDARTAAGLLARPERIRALATLVEHEARSWEASHDVVRAHALYAHARSLWLEIAQDADATRAAKLEELAAQLVRLEGLAPGGAPRGAGD